MVRRLHNPCTNGKRAQSWVSTGARTASTDEWIGANIYSIPFIAGHDLFQLEYAFDAFQDRGRCNYSTLLLTIQ